MFKKVEVFVKYYAEIQKWDSQHNCSDGIINHGPFTEFDVANDFLEKNGFVINGPYYIKNDNSVAIVKKTYAETLNV